MSDKPISNAVGDTIESVLSGLLNRRRFLWVGGGLALSAATLPSVLKAAPPYRVGVGRSSNPYLATRRAILACGEWPALGVAGKVVIIKPNLVVPSGPETGAITDAEVVRAVVDMALADGAAFILIVEAGSQGANFAACGYSFFNAYDPRNRIRLVDLETLPPVLTPLPRGWVYGAVYAPNLVLRRDFVFINVAKLKTHWETLATLTTKNVFGIPAVNRYPSDSPLTLLAPRYGLHDRGVHQAIIDVNLLRPSDFAVIDGIVGMEGRGPFLGTPKRMNIVLAGRNTVAVDRVGLAAMEIPQRSVRYLRYASTFRFGPSGLSQIDVLGDPLTTMPFEIPTLSPNFNPPLVTPDTFVPGSGQTISVLIVYHQACIRTVEVVRFYDENPTRDLIRTLVPSSYQGTGTQVLTWDGRANDGTLVPPGKYAVRISAYELTFVAPPGVAIGWVSVE